MTHVNAHRHPNHPPESPSRPGRRRMQHSASNHATRVCRFFNFSISTIQPRSTHSVTPLARRFAGSFGLMHYLLSRLHCQSPNLQSPIFNAYIILIWRRPARKVRRILQNISVSIRRHCLVPERESARQIYVFRAAPGSASPCPAGAPANFPPRDKPDSVARTTALREKRTEERPPASRWAKRNQLLRTGRNRIGHSIIP